MYVDLRTPGLRLPRGRAHALLQQVRTAFAGATGAVLRVIVRVVPVAAEPTLRECAVVVHLANGEVAVAQERERRLGAATARALRKALQLTLRRSEEADAAASRTPTLPLPRMRALR